MLANGSFQSQYLRKKLHFWARWYPKVASLFAHGLSAPSAPLGLLIAHGNGLTGPGSQVKAEVKLYLNEKAYD